MADGSRKIHHACARRTPRSCFGPFERSTLFKTNDLTTSPLRGLFLSVYLVVELAHAYTTNMPTPQLSLQGNNDVFPENRITYFALTDTRNRHVPFGIKKNDRSRHTYVIGKTGMGKSTLLENMAIQDIQNGEGLCFIDPHGGTAEKLLDYIPEERVKDVLYLAPFDLQYPISFNVLENVEPDRRHLVVNGLMSTFEKLWVDQWSARMSYILQNTLAALLEYPDATLLGVNRMYIDRDYRRKVIANISDASVRSFWVDEYAKYTDKYAQEATPAIQNKIGQFVSNALVRNIIGQPKSTFDIRQLMDERKIFIVNLSKGRVGEGNANLLGSMLITKIYLAAMSRADAAPSVLGKLPDFYLYVDEFQNFANKSFADILSEARKYKLALTIAHQYIEQMEEEVRAAVFGNVGTTIAFRVGAFDAEVLEKEFSPVFTADDLVNLGARQIYLKLMIDGVTSQPFSGTTMAPIPAGTVSNRDRAIAFSRRNFSRPRDEVEAEITAWTQQSFEEPKEKGEGAARTPSPYVTARSQQSSSSPSSSRTSPYRTNQNADRGDRSRESFERRDYREREPRPRYQAQTERSDDRPREYRSPTPKETTSQSLKETLAKLATQEREKSEKVKEREKEKDAQRPVAAPISRDDKSATDEDRKALKNVLASVMQTQEQKSPTQKPPQPAPPAPVKKPSEVPESVLRNVLAVEEQ